MYRYNRYNKYYIGIWLRYNNNLNDYQLFINCSQFIIQIENILQFTYKNYVYKITG